MFTPLLAAIGKLNGSTYGGKLDDRTDTGFRVIADHLRMATFAIVDGARPGNKKRDAVLRSVIRRAVRYGYLCFDRREPFLFSLVPTLVEQMGAAFPELRECGAMAADVLKAEEKDFFRTVARGLKLFDAAADNATGGVFEGKTAADLLTTHGFPADLTAQMAVERGLTFDHAGFEAAYTKHQTDSGPEGGVKFVVSAMQGELPETDDTHKYHARPAYGAPAHVYGAKVLGWVQDNRVVASGNIPEGEVVALLLDHTPFYAEQGGQVGDTGYFQGQSGRFVVTDTKRLGSTVLHIGRVETGELAVGEHVDAAADPRDDTERNHTATHLMNLALRDVLGAHVEQKGSLVDRGKTRFDFSHDKPLTADDVRQVEERVNAAIGHDLMVAALVLPLAEAKQITGVRAVFGEKYPDPVRVVMIGTNTPETAHAGLSVEYCGGTHVQRTGPIGLFKIVSQEGVAKGVRRVTAVTGRAAVEYARQAFVVLDELSSRFNCPPNELPARIAVLQEELKKAQAALKKGAAADLGVAVDKLFDKAVTVNGTKLVIGQLPGGSVEAVRTQIDRVRQKAASAVVVFGWEDDGRVPLIVSLTNDLVAKGLKAADEFRLVDDRRVSERSVSVSPQGLGDDFATAQVEAGLFDRAACFVIVVDAYQRQSRAIDLAAFDSWVARFGEVLLEECYGLGRSSNPPCDFRREDRVQLFVGNQPQHRGQRGGGGRAGVTEVLQEVAALCRLKCPGLDEMLDPAEALLAWCDEPNRQRGVGPELFVREHRFEIR